jgi:hypothetical protein
LIKENFLEAKQQALALFYDAEDIELILTCEDKFLRVIRSKIVSLTTSDRCGVWAII